MTDDLGTAMQVHRFTRCMEEVRDLVQRTYPGAVFGLQVVTRDQLPLQGGSLAPWQVLYMLAAMWHGQQNGAVATIDGAFAPRPPL